MGFVTGELTLRVRSTLLLVPMAIATAYLGGWPFAVFWVAAAIGVLWEWIFLVTARSDKPLFVSGAGALALALLLVFARFQGAALLVLAIGAFTAAMLAPPGRRVWLASGIPYAGTLGFAP